MHDQLESQVWRVVQKTSDAAALKVLLLEAVASFKRRPGLDPLARLHASDIGLLGIQVLHDVLRSQGIRSESSIEIPGCVELRSRLKDHIRFCLQQHLVSGEHASNEMKEDQLGRDLGL